MRLHIDNNATTAVIHPALLNGSVAADANCGLIRYGDPGTDTVTIAYTASHPNGFADYSFEFKRGTTPLTPPSASGQATGTFSSSPSVGSLLSVNCTIAGFAENLNVIGRATDGWSRLGYDAHDLAAFVLAPPKETP
jgi:hypothetical protein